MTRACKLTITNHDQPTSRRHRRHNFFRHYLLNRISVRSAWFERLVKASAENLVRGGRVNRKLMRKLEISESDLLE